MFTHATLFFKTSLIALSIAVIAPVSAIAGGPTGWGGGSCNEIATSATITSPGVYCLNFKNMRLALKTGAFITIAANDVVLDLNGATIDGAGAGEGTGSIGIEANNRHNITVRNGVVKGFTHGVVLKHLFAADGADIRPSHRLVVENIDALGNQVTGIRVEGHDSVIRNNYVANTGGSSTMLTYTSAWGIYASGWGTRIINNDVSHIRAVGDGGAAYGIYLVGTQEAVAINNRLTDMQFGLYGASPMFWGKYRDNVTVNVTMPYTGGTDIGNNN